MTCASGSIPVTINWFRGSFQAEVGWEIVRTSDQCVLACEATSGGIPPVTTLRNAGEGQYSVLAYDSFGDGWNGGILTVINNSSGETFGPYSYGFGGGGTNTCNGIPSGGTSVGTFVLESPFLSCQIQGTDRIDPCVEDQNTGEITITTSGTPPFNVTICKNGVPIEGPFPTSQRTINRTGLGPGVYEVKISDSSEDPDTSCTWTIENRVIMGDLPRLEDPSLYLDALCCLEEHYKCLVKEIELKKKPCSSEELDSIVEALECALRLLHQLIETFKFNLKSNPTQVNSATKATARCFFQYLVDNSEWLATLDSFGHQITSVDSYAYHFGVYLPDLNRCLDDVAPTRLRTCGAAPTGTCDIGCSPVETCRTPNFPRGHSNSLSQLACVTPQEILDWLADVGCTAVPDQFEIEGVVNSPNPLGSLFNACRIIETRVKIDSDPTDITLCYNDDTKVEQVTEKFKNSTYTSYISRDFAPGIVLTLKSRDGTGINRNDPPVVTVVENCETSQTVDEWTSGSLEITLVMNRKIIGFTGPFAPENWTITKPPLSGVGNGEDTLGNVIHTDTLLEILSGLDAGAEVKITVPVSGIVSFDYSGRQEAILQDDIVIIEVGGVKIIEFLEDNPGGVGTVDEINEFSGTATVNVLSGQEIIFLVRGDGFRSDSIDSLIRITNFCFTF